ncbi:hypothetical protein [Candidatus Palauibacter sp.]|uniref:hypothetical protein n=1 Tax=Candidatus Palauibacter sp. TaxID=3101350 RepID=UPI003B0220B2
MSERGFLRGIRREMDRHQLGDFDRGVILRAHRFRAEIVGYRLERGHYMDREDDRADRWYAVPISEKNPRRDGPGHKTSAKAAEEAERLAAEAEKTDGGAKETDDTA